jgi:hypothetical protein
MRKNLWFLAIGSAAVGCFSFFKFWDQKAENHRLNLVNSILSMERNILKDEISQLENKPTYEEGFEDAILRMGGPQNPGSYQDGWDAAIKVIGDSGYADGYHAAIKQFGYQKMGETKRWMVPQSESSQKEDEKK